MYNRGMLRDKYRAIIKISISFLVDSWRCVPRCVAIVINDFLDSFNILSTEL